MELFGNQPQARFYQISAGILNTAVTLTRAHKKLTSRYMHKNCRDDHMSWQEVANIDITLAIYSLK